MFGKQLVLTLWHLWLEPFYNVTSKPPIFSHSRSDCLSIALWWGLVAGFGEGLSQIFMKPWIWRDLMRAAVTVEPLLFGGVALLIMALSRSQPITRKLLVRATLGFGFMAAYIACDALVPRVISSLSFFVTSLALASIFAAFFYFQHQRALRFQKKSLVFLTAAAA
jgi:hypothetical protein